MFYGISALPEVVHNSEINCNNSVITAYLGSLAGWIPKWERVVVAYPEIRGFSLYIRGSIELRSMPVVVLTAEVRLTIEHECPSAALELRDLQTRLH
jgi:hypothetical protein